MIYDLIIIGGGAAGLFAAAVAKDMNVLLLEKKAKPGMKLIVSGGGMGNLTHSGYMNRFLSKYGDHKTFVKPALNSFKNSDLISYLENIGIKCVEREDGKIFPESLSAKAVADAFRKQIENSSSKTLKTNEPVKAVIKKGAHYCVETDEGCYTAKTVLLATGGKSYPALGAEGDGYALAEVFGHAVVHPKPGLTGIVSGKISTSELQGISLREAGVKHYRQGVLMSQYKDDLLITHFGLSGPVILNNSRWFEKGDVLKLSFLEEASKSVEAKFLSADGSKPLSYWINSLGLQDRIKKFIYRELSLNGEEKIASLTKDVRRELVNCLCEYPVLIDSLIGFSKAMVTVGGVALDNVNSKTMESKLSKGLYFAGEILDVDGDTGGYNLQWAFSSAYVAIQAIQTGFRD